ncbi:Heat shock protein DnaJ-like protein [unidentified eubacterium SCB49]|nr:Heat shock protein DnaJ-like protein [unidentified eubacterium SCB49]
MTNPYTILGVSQDANKSEIMKAQMFAMKNKEFPLQIIAVAAKQLLDPSKRLAADFMFPAKIKVKRIKPIQCDLKHKEINTDSLNKNAFNSLK